jgi:hypothetical protein
MLQQRWNILFDQYNHHLVLLNLVSKRRHRKSKDNHSNFIHIKTIYLQIRSLSIHPVVYEYNHIGRRFVEVEDHTPSQQEDFVVCMKILKMKMKELIRGQMYNIYAMLRSSYVNITRQYNMCFIWQINVWVKSTSILPLCHEQKNVYNASSTQSILIKKKCYFIWLEWRNHSNSDTYLT